MTALEFNNCVQLKDNEPLGSGNFGTVYKASWLNDNAEQTIAVKRFNHIAEENIASLSSAVKLMQQVKHEHIIAIYGLNIDNEQRTLLLMEYAENGSLYNYIYADKRDYNQELALHWMYQCAKGLAHLHALQPQIIHGDLKPQNMLLSNGYRTLKLSDYSQITEQATHMTAAVIVSSYMAPELAILENSSYTEKSDVYSFGIALWEVLARKQPYYHLNNRNSLAIKYKAAVENERPCLADVSSSKYLKMLIENCWDKQPQRRPSMQDLVLSIGAGSFELQQQILLGSGSFGTVLKANWQTSNGQMLIAVKRFHDIAAAEKIHKEVKLLSFVNHDNIVKLYGTSIDNKSGTLLLMEYAENGSLHDYLHKSELTCSTKTALNWMYQCATGLEYLHAQTPKVIHRDLKTHNLLLTNKYRTLKICDFGTVTEMATRMTAEVGTAYYMAPEVAYLKQNNNYTEKCDIYSFGIVLWEVLTRRKPFYHLPNSNSISIIYNVVIDDARPLLDDVKIETDTDYMRGLLGFCWHKQPELRPTASVLKLALDLYPHNVDNEQLKLMYNMDFNRVKYAATDLIGSGNFGNVYKAKWKTDMGEMTIAVKQFHKNEQPPEKFNANINLELKQLEAVSCEHILKLYGTTIDATAATVLLMEYAENGSLYKYIHEEQREYSYKTALDWICQCATGLDYLHNLQPIILHCNLKTQNLLLSNSYRTLKISDCGSLTDMTRFAVTIDTASYIAPELALAKHKTFTQKCDVYSFGIVFWELMSHKKPFYDLADQSALSIMYKAAIEDVRPSLDDIKQYRIRSHIKHIINQCWTKDPNCRQEITKVKDYLNVLRKWYH
ncbi:dual specificity protein kinase pyk3 [Drosophila busckii]|uniref:dual specificity protein kinase pyk3 n=1 Tax=Drosophila busckii TaxID=30019 RepID=UPI00083EF31F|nr:dual specificity protein kinase pyk3 [Drosophila busckii]